MKFELSDDTVLKVSSLAAASFGAHSWAAPEHYMVNIRANVGLCRPREASSFANATTREKHQVTFACSFLILQDLYFEKEAARSHHQTRVSFILLSHGHTNRSLLCQSYY